MTENEQLRSQLARVCQQRDALALAMWQARAILGFDNDGDPTPAAIIAGMGWEGYTDLFLAEMKDMRAAYDQALEEIPFHV